MNTKLHEISIVSVLKPDECQGFDFLPAAACHDGYRPIIGSLKTLERFSRNGADIVLALLDDRKTIGLAVLDKPEGAGRWGMTDRPYLMELKAVEVARDFRGRGIARSLLDHLLANPVLEEKIIYLTAYSWLWDLDFYSHPVQVYRDMLVSLYSAFGFCVCRTNEPNICMRPENLFMVRAGKQVPDKINKDFRLLRYGLIP